MEGIVRRRNSGWSKLNQISSLDVDGDGESFESCTQFLYVRYAINRFYKISVFAKSFGISFHACCFETFSIKYLWLFQDRRHTVTSSTTFLCQRSYSIIIPSLRPQLVILLQTITDVGCETTQDE